MRLYQIQYWTALNVILQIVSEFQITCVEQYVISLTIYVYF